MSNDELPRENPNRPETPREEELRTLLVRLLELVAVHVADKLQQGSPAEPGEKSPKRPNPGSSSGNRGR